MMTQLDQVTEEAIWAMHQLHYYMPAQLDTEGSKVQDRITLFLSSPEVQARLKQQPLKD